MRLLILNITTLILLIHSVIPHYHENGKAVLPLCIDANSDNFLDNLLASFINVDLGEGHMEDFQSGQGLPNISLDVDLFDVVLVMVYPELQNRTIDSFERSGPSPPDEIVRPQFRQSSKSLRAPPSLIIG